MVIQYLATLVSGVVIGLLANWQLTCVLLSIAPLVVGSSAAMARVFFAVMSGAFGIGNVLPYLNSVSTAIGSADVILSIIDRKPSIDPYGDDGVKPAFRGEIEFKNVHFTYPTRKNVPVLNGLSVRVEAGQTVAFIGSSGAGKSTIVNLLMRFYDATDGQILVDGYDVRFLNLRWFRRNVGVVSQEPVLFAVSVAENIRYGREGVTDDDIVKAAKIANAHNFIEALPDGYNTQVGERGAQLSGGQKQRIAIARALVRDPKILLLDEATSALDAKSETIVQKALDSAMEGRTTLIIAHRLSTIKNSNRIYAMKKYDRIIWRLLKINTPDWPLLLIGFLSCAVNGTITPVFAFFYAQIFAILSMTAVAERLLARLRLASFQNMLKQQISWFDFEEHSSGKLQTVLAKEAPITKSCSGLRAGQILSTICTLIAAVAIACIFGWQLALILCLGVPVLVYASYKQMASLRTSLDLNNQAMNDAGKVSRGQISFEDVHFSYPIRPEQPILRGLNLSIAAGETVALVGESGCGKSTIISLLERFYKPSSGSIKLDGIGIDRIKLSSLRSQLGIVTQEPILFSGTIKYNIAYGALNRELTDAEIIEAAKKANIHNFICSLPLGYETPCGDRGTQMSGGQKQRIAIARALIRNPKILLLDEATSALDVESEKVISSSNESCTSAHLMALTIFIFIFQFFQVVQEALDQARIGRTSLIVSHRLSTVQNADKIVVIQNGVVVESGTHAELMESQGFYHQLVKKQQM
ncbi:unnamed protein product [Nesidiocoris tenuis]|uniref:ABC transporter domain-containing protein n=1 Tax=Nesidiocoris tenuis TaxID=355587 RepID=A0A6H5HFX0_9HEMI|nr:unnamed protein product [Nesidiocoris tenuis]